MEKKAAAWAQYKDAAVIDMVLQTLPRIAAEIAAPLTSAEKITMIAGISWLVHIACALNFAYQGPNGDIGASKITSEILEMINTLPSMVKSFTGVDVSMVLDLIISLALY